MNHRTAREAQVQHYRPVNCPHFKYVNAIGSQRRDQAERAARTADARVIQCPLCSRWLIRHGSPA